MTAAERPHGPGGAGAARRGGHRQGVRLPRARRRGRSQRRRRGADRAPRPPGRRAGSSPSTSSPRPGVALQAAGQGERRGPAPELIDLAGVGGVAVGRSPGALPAHRVAARRGAGAPAPARGADAPRAGADRTRRRRRSPRPWPADRAVLRLPPGRRPLPAGAGGRAGAGAGAGGQTLVLCPSVAEARALGRRLRRDGVRTGGRGRRRPRGGRRGGVGPGRVPAPVVVGARAAAWAPVAAARPGRGARRARRGLPAGAGPDLARPRRGGRAGPAGRRPVPAGVAVPDARGARLGRAGGADRGRRAGGLAPGRGGRPARARPGARPAVLAGAGATWCGATAGWCAC